jgi:UDP-N-acetylmuramate dehydrogenase
MPLFAEFAESCQVQGSLSPYTHLKTGGRAEYLIQPRTIDELKKVLAYCHDKKIPMRMLGGGFNLLIRDEAIPGAVVRLHGPAFSEIVISGATVRAGGGASLYDLIAATVKANLRGLETLVGIRGTVGGSVRCNVGDRTGEIASCVRRVAVLSEKGNEQIRTKEMLHFGEHSSDLEEPVILWVEFELAKEKPESLLRRMRKAWIMRKAVEPLSHQKAVRMFRNPAGESASQMIERAGLAKTKVGGAEVSDRNGNYVVAHPGTTAADILKLMDVIKTTVRDSKGISLERELNVW